MLFLILLISLFCFCINAMPSISITANVRGKRYELEAETVEDVCEAVEEVAGLDASQQSVLFRGKLLSPGKKLEDLGVSSGDTVNVVKGRRQRSAPKVSESLPMDDDIDNDVSSSSGGNMMNAMGGGMGGLGDMLGMGGGGAGGMTGMSEEEIKKAMENVDPAEMQKAMKAMDEILDSDFVEEYFADEDRLGNARQQMLSNLDQYEQMMPGFKEQAAEIASSPEKWKEAMNQAREQIANLKEQRDKMRGSGFPKPDQSIDDFDDDED